MAHNTSSVTPVLPMAIVADNLTTLFKTGKSSDDLISITKQAFGEHLKQTDKRFNEYVLHMNQARSRLGAATNDRPDHIKAARRAIAVWHDTFSFLDQSSHELAKELVKDPAFKRIKSLEKMLTISRMSNTPLPTRALEQLSKEDQKLDDVEHRRIIVWVDRVQLSRKDWIDIHHFHCGLEALVELFNTTTAPQRNDFVEQPSDLSILEYRLYKEFKCKILEKPDPAYLKEIEEFKEGSECEIDGKPTKVGERPDSLLQLMTSTDAAVFPIRGIAEKTEPASELGSVNFSINAALPYINYGAQKLNTNSSVPLLSLTPRKVRWISNGQSGSCTIMPGDIIYLNNVKWKTKKAEDDKETELAEEDRPIVRALSVFAGQQLLKNETLTSLDPSNIVYDANDHTIKARKMCQTGTADPKALREFLQTITRMNSIVESELIKMSCVAQHPFEGAFYLKVLQSTYAVLCEVEEHKNQPTSIEKLIEETHSNEGVQDSGITLRKNAKDLHVKCEQDIIDNYHIKNEQRLPAKKAIGVEICKQYQANGLVGTLDVLNTPAGIVAISAAIAAEFGFGRKQNVVNLSIPK